MGTVGFVLGPALSVGSPVLYWAVEAASQIYIVRVTPYRPAISCWRALRTIQYNTPSSPISSVRESVRVAPPRPGNSLRRLRVTFSSLAFMHPAQPDPLTPWFLRPWAASRVAAQCHCTAPAAPDLGDSCNGTERRGGFSYPYGWLRYCSCSRHTRNIIHASIQRLLCPYYGCHSPYKVFLICIPNQRAGRR